MSFPVELTPSGDSSKRNLIQYATRQFLPLLLPLLNLYSKLINIQAMFQYLVWRLYKTGISICQKSRKDVFVFFSFSEYALKQKLSSIIYFEAHSRTYSAYPLLTHYSRWHISVFVRRQSYFLMNFDEKMSKRNKCLLWTAHNTDVRCTPNPTRRARFKCLYVSLTFVNNESHWVKLGTNSPFGSIGLNLYLR